MAAKQSMAMPPSLSAVHIINLPETAFYISDFLNEQEEAYILDKVGVECPAAFNILSLSRSSNRGVQIRSRPSSSWTQLSHRRLQVYPSALSTNNEMSAGPLPEWLEDPVIARLLGIPLSAPSSDERSPRHLFSTSPHGRPNHVLINEYPPSVGIFPHEDGSAYHPIVATVSMGGYTVLDIYEKEDTGMRAGEPKWRVLQERRSLLVTMGDVYKHTLHGIAEISADEQLREDTVANWGLLRPETRRKCDESGGRLERELRISATLRDVLTVRNWGRLIPGLKGRK